MGFTARPAPLTFLEHTSLEAIEKQRATAAAAATRAAFGAAGPAAPHLVTMRLTVDRVRAEFGALGDVACSFVE